MYPLMFKPINILDSPTRQLKESWPVVLPSIFGTLAYMYVY